MWLRGFELVVLLLLAQVNFLGATIQIDQASSMKILEDGSANLLEISRKQEQQQIDGLIGSEAKQVLLASNSIHGKYDKKLFVVELLKMLHEQYGSQKAIIKETQPINSDNMNKKEDREVNGSTLIPNHAILSALLGAIGVDGDVRRLIDWIQNSFNLASIGELTTQFVVSKLGSVNCAALLAPDREETLVPRFLLFNEHFIDVPFELTIKPTQTDCFENGRFDPLRKTMVLIHGYLAGYTIVDGLTNIKNRLLDLNKIINKRAIKVFKEAAINNGSSYLLSEDLELKVRQQQYNVIIVDWFNGANPLPRSNYIRAAVNAQVVGQLIGRFLSALIVQCRAPAPSIQIIAHSLGCHVAGFTGKAMQAAGHRLGKITHLDPIGLCFGRLFSEPRFRLNPQDALETHAVHVSLNIFDNPLDGAQSNFLVNGGRDQLGCGGGQSEVQNSTSSSVSLLWDSEMKFTPCSHVRALSLFEDDLSSEPGQCQIVGYRCNTYERFLAGKCGLCDVENNQCRLMSLAPISTQFKKISTITTTTSTTNGHNIDESSLEHLKGRSVYRLPDDQATKVTKIEDTLKQPPNLVNLVNNISNGSIAWLIDDNELNQKIGSTIAKLRPDLIVETQSRDIQDKSDEMEDFIDETETIYPQNQNLPTKTRVDRRLSNKQRARLSQTIYKIRTDTRNALSDGLSAFRFEEQKFKVIGSMIGKSPFAHHHHHHLPSFSVINPVDGLRHLSATVVGGASAAVAEGNKGIALEKQLTGNPSPPPPPVPLGGQALPPGSTNSPLYFVGTGAVSPYCVNYYQFRLLIAESRISRLILNGQARTGGLFREAHISSQNKPPSTPTTTAASGGGTNLNENTRQRQAVLDKDKLHLTIKLTDSDGHFFKGFTLIEDARSLINPAAERLSSPVSGAATNMIELTMLLNTTKVEPVRISETIISYYFTVLCWRI